MTNADALTFTGLTKASHIVTGLDANGKYEYRVKAVPVDTENFGDSRWTDKVLLDLSDADTSGITDITAPATDESAEYFTLQGIRLPSLPSAPGIYIRKTSVNTEKVTVK